MEIISRILLDNEIIQHVPAFKYLEILINVDDKTGGLKEKGRKYRNFNET